MRDVGGARDNLVAAALAWTEYRYEHIVRRPDDIPREVDENLLRASEAYYAERAGAYRDEEEEHAEAFRKDEERLEKEYDE